MYTFLLCPVPPYLPSYSISGPQMFGPAVLGKIVMHE